MEELALVLEYFSTVAVQVRECYTKKDGAKDFLGTIVIFYLSLVSIGSFGRCSF